MNTRPDHACDKPSSSLVMCLAAGTLFLGSAHGSRSMAPITVTAISKTQVGVYRSSVGRFGSLAGIRDHVEEVLKRWV